MQKFPAKLDYARPLTTTPWPRRLDALYGMGVILLLFTFFVAPGFVNANDQLFGIDMTVRVWLAPVIPAIACLAKWGWEYRKWIAGREREHFNAAED